MKKSLKPILLGVIVVLGTVICAVSCSKDSKVTCTCHEYTYFFGPRQLSNTFTVNPVDEGFNTCLQFQTYMIAQNDDEGFDYECYTN